MNLVIYITAYKDATQDEIATFIYNEGGDITKKKASTEAYQANSDDAQFRVYRFFNCPPLLVSIRCPEGSLLMWMNLKLPLRNVIGQGGGL